MPSHIGIVAVSGEGAALCFRTICNEGAALMGAHSHPEISMHTFSFKLHVDAINKNDWQTVADLMLASTGKLASIGADFAICPDNTAHQAMPLILPHSPIPWLHIAEEVARDAQQRGYRRVGVTGTRSLVSSDLYPEALAAVGIEAVRPSPEQQRRIDTIIFKELVYGQFLPTSRTYLMEVAASLQEDGCDALILGCTELPILAEGVEPPLPTLDSTRILARAALNRAAH
jgi:aspartate racemase